MDIPEFRKQAHQLVDWMADYLENIETYPVKSPVKPKDIFNQIPQAPPEKPEIMTNIFEDFKEIIMPGITHWQSPNFFAYFPANSSYPSILGEMLTATLAAQCMKWETSPAATELEEKMMDWLKQLIGLPVLFEGVIQDSASTSTLAAILAAREHTSGFQINENGYLNKKLRVYCSSETHSSIDKAVKIAGIGHQNLVKVPVDEAFRLIPESLEIKIKQDIENGFIPTCVVATLGTTGSTAIDPLKEMAAICKKYNVWLHVDAAYAGSALVLEEFRWMIDGIEDADSFVFNPHKWMFTNFDCSALFIKNRETLVKTFQLVPEYLKSDTDKQVNNYSDWGVQLGRRFRALKLWFTIRNFGAENIRTIIQKHIRWGEMFEQFVYEDPNFELLAPRTLNLVCFRYVISGLSNEQLDKINAKLLSEINTSGEIYITHTRLNGIYCLRFVASQTYVQEEHIKNAWKTINKHALAIQD
jgi:aromatic-L-amino-acid decarboxylase